MSEYRYLIYETIDDGEVAVISLNRPRQRNAQNRGILIELNDAFMAAEADDAVKVVVLRGEGDVFSSGHDLGSEDYVREYTPGPDQHISFRTDGGTKGGAEFLWRQEWKYFLEYTRRWRDLRKITIAAVHGPVYAAALMLMWCCDLIVADEETTFADIVGARLGMCGVEYFAHPWEFGARRAKELLLTGDAIDADEAYRIGMLSRVFAPERLREDTLEFARRIATRASATSLMIKEAVNQTQDNQGFHNSLQAAFTLHELNHSHWAIMSEGKTYAQTRRLGGVNWKEAPPIRLATKDKP